MDPEKRETEGEEEEEVEKSRCIRPTPLAAYQSAVPMLTSMTLRFGHNTSAICAAWTSQEEEDGDEGISPDEHKGGEAPGL